MFAKRVLRKLKAMGSSVPAFDYSKYWENRYRTGGQSGAGSYGHLAEFKASVVNQLIKENAVTSILDFGCGDGNQLSLFHPVEYTGLDLSVSVLEKTMKRYEDDASKSFFLFHPRSFRDRSEKFRADLCLSLDVLYHIVDDTDYELYVKQLFQCAKKHVLIYSSDKNVPYQGGHVRHRPVTEDVKRWKSDDWHFTRKIPNPYPEDKFPHPKGSFADFYLYSRRKP